MDKKGNNENFHAVNVKRQVLIVDDEMINREILGEYLYDDYDVLFAADGVEAMDTIREHRDTLSLVLLDLLMPVMSGKDVLLHMKADLDLSHIPVIVMTADQQSEVECLELGAIDFIPKPYPLVNVVQARVRRTIELSEDRRIISVTERDNLTGLYNKEYFYRYAEQYDRHFKGLEMDAVIIDINHFHMLNERYGKAYGDEVLRKLGQALKDEVREKGGMVCRREADTFLVYCPHREDYRELLDKLTDLIAGDETSGYRIRLRLGAYSPADKSIDIERRFDRAKIAADSVQGNYNKTIAIYDNKLSDQELYAEQLIDDFHTAIEERQFRVYFQPKFDIRPDKPILSSAEALVRWNHPTLGLISPGVFIPLFENNGLIRKLDTYVWEETARQISIWRKKLGGSVPISVNVSRVDLYDPNVEETLRRIVKENGLSPADQILEITESAYTEDSVQIIDMVKRLREQGFRIEMDDFGTGYSSLNMISHLPIDALKLDMQFIRNAFREGGDTRMLEVIIDIADYLSVPVVAEGVESLDQMKALKAMGCDIAQGFYFSRPVPAEEFFPFLEEWKKSEAEAAAAAAAEMEAAKSRTIAEIIEPQMRAKSQIAEADTRARPVGAERRHETKGISLRLMNMIFSVVAVIIAVALYWADYSVTGGYQRMEQASERYVAAQQAASEMESSSDYLTDRVRCFAITGELQYMQDFFDEIEVTHRRENALANMGEMLEGSDNKAYEQLAEALDLSNELVEREYLSMRLITEVNQYDLADIPPAIRNIEIPPEMQSLSPEEMREKARMLVFDDYYMGHKELIREKVRLCTEDLILKSSQELDQASARMEVLLRWQSILTGLLLFVVLSLVIFISIEVRKPLSQMVYQMKSQKAVSPTGAEELRFVTRTYNEILLENKKAHAQLTYEASHDALTGLFNRGAYEMMLKSVDAEHIALILIDVDYFKTVNDTYGHDVGDKVLKRVAEILQGSFRSVDVICRIGGDEFVVIMTRANSSMRQIVHNKILQANTQLRNPKDDLPPVSLSVGVAFSDRKNPEGDIFKDADTALYRAKEKGKGRCEIY